ncbi:MAG: hypothetical protein FWC65_02485 [Treponema sp.]|nr:hypothetical protein [Treponema sp.]
MKKILVLLAALSLVGGAAFAQQDDLGLTAGLEFGIVTLNHDDIDAMDTAWIRPMLIWENDDLVEGLDLYAEIGLPLWFNDAADETWINMDLTLRGTYNLGITPEGTLSFTLESFTHFDFSGDDAVGLDGFVAPRGIMFRHILSGGEDVNTALGFGVRYTHALEGMSFFGQVALPFNLFGNGDYAADAFDFANLDFTVGMNMDLDFGLLGFELELQNTLMYAGESADDFVQWLVLTPSVALADIPLYAEVAVTIPLFENGMDLYGLTITPEVRFMAMDNLQVYFNLPVRHVGADVPDVLIGMGLGVLFRF